MRRLGLVLLGAAGLSLGSAASAADLGPAPAPVYVKAPIPVPQTWGGFYAGGNGGWVGSTGNDIDLTGTDSDGAGLGSSLAAGNIPSTINLGYSGYLLGGQFGYNWQSGNWVFGIETDLDWVSASASTNVPDARIINPTGGMNSPFSTNASRELDWLGTLRGRLGYAFTPPFLLYATGGLAYGEHKLGIGVDDPGAVPPLDAFSETSKWSIGWTVGAGAEWMFAPHWSLKAEYLYVDLGSISSSINYDYTRTPPGTAETSSLTATAHDRDNIVRGGINYHF
jgi:outer membrane immunogenic protein